MIRDATGDGLYGAAGRRPGGRRLVAASVFTGLLFASAAFAAQTAQPLRAGGMEIFYGLIPVEIVLGHPDSHPERRMHDGVPAWGEQFHLIVSIFDQGSGKRVPDADVKATMYDVRSPVKRVAGPQKRLEPMLFGGAKGYGNYFNMPGPDVGRDRLLNFGFRRHQRAAVAQGAAVSPVKGATRNFAMIAPHQSLPGAASRRKRDIRAT